MFQVDVLHFSHFPTWQTLGLRLHLGPSSSGSWILILAWGFLWQVRSLVRMQGASPAFALKSTAEKALLLFPGAGGMWSRQRGGKSCRCFSPSLPGPLVHLTWVGGIRGAGCIVPFLACKPVHTPWRLVGELSTAQTFLPGVLNTPCNPATWHMCLLRY